MPDFTTADGRGWWTDKRRYLVSRPRHRRIQDRRRRARLGPRPAVRRRPPRRRGQQPQPSTTPGPTATCCAPARRRSRSPERLHRVTGPRHLWAGDEDSTWEAFGTRSPPGSPRGVRHRLLGLGHRRFLRAGARRGAVPARHRRGDVHADHAVPLGVQPPPPSAAGPHAVEHRRDATTTRASSRLPALRAAARALVPYLAEQARRRRDRPAADAGLFFDHPPMGVWEPQQLMLGDDSSSTP